jgi:hypothetical protein
MTKKDWLIYFLCAIGIVAMLVLVRWLVGTGLGRW